MPVTSAASGLSAGTIAYFAASAAPAGFVKANGAAVSRTTYAALFLAIGTTYGAGDGSNTFNVPDLRGEFVRGLDDGRGIDSGRAIGTAQAQANTAAKNPTTKYNFNGATWASGAVNGFGFGDNTASDAETRPRNVALLACIKF